MSATAMLGPSSSKIICEPISAVAVDDLSSRKPPMSKSAWVLPVALRAAPFSMSTRLWSADVVYSIDWPATTPVMVATPAVMLMARVELSPPSAPAAKVSSTAPVTELSTRTLMIEITASFA
ncbi:hypothetical protein D9M72_495560 [compost metagenome]